MSELKGANPPGSELRRTFDRIVSSYAARRIRVSSEEEREEVKTARESRLYMNGEGFKETKRSDLSPDIDLLRSLLLACCKNITRITKLRRRE